MAQLQRRDEISPDLKWRLEDIYASDQAWEEDLAQLKIGIQGVLDLKGKLTSGENLLSALQQMDEIGRGQQVAGLGGGCLYCIGDHVTVDDGDRRG